ncbi:MAG: hypothetical protein IJU58_04135 [Clostridia bacterium]|nr:hypothetical protein [Clostridia bacterium]
MNNKKAPIKLLWCVVLRAQVEEACQVLDKMGGCTALSMMGYRLKTHRLADLFGVGDYECAVILSMVPSNQSTKILDTLCKKFEWETKLGIGITTPINAISRNALTGFYDMQKQIKLLLDLQEAAKVKPEKENTAPQEVQE